MSRKTTVYTFKARLADRISAFRARKDAKRAEQESSEVLYTELNTFPVSPHTIAHIMFSLALVPTLYTIFAVYCLPWRPDNHKLISGSVFLLWFIAIVLGAIVGMYWDNQNADKAIKRRGDYVTDLTPDSNEFESFITASYAEAEVYSEEVRREEEAAKAAEAEARSSSPESPSTHRNPYL